MILLHTPYSFYIPLILSCAFSLSSSSLVPTLLFFCSLSLSLSFSLSVHHTLSSSFGFCYGFFFFLCSSFHCFLPQVTSYCGRTGAFPVILRTITLLTNYCRVSLSVLRSLDVFCSDGLIKTLGSIPARESEKRLPHLMKASCNSPRISRGMGPTCI